MSLNMGGLPGDAMRAGLVIQSVVDEEIVYLEQLKHLMDQVG